MAPQRLHQIQVSYGPLASEMTTSGGLKQDENHTEEHERFQAALVSKCPSHLWPKGSYRSACPRPILVSPSHRRQIAELSDALTAAVNNIVERWWTDQGARFYDRMPLKRDEGDLLKWLETQVENGKLRDFRPCSGSWRPDFLIEDRAEPDAIVETFRITEINARFPFNGAIHLTCGQEALDDMDLGGLQLASTTSPKQIFEGLESLFDPRLPLHLLIGEEAGIDIHMFIDAARKRFGVTSRLINPLDLRLEPANRGDKTDRLCCLVRRDAPISPHPEIIFNNDYGEELEEIRQVGLELHLHELFALPRDMLRRLALCCFNDLRTILLVHDKRMLGIVKQELPHLVQEKVLTPDQARILYEGIIDTFIPDSPELTSFLKRSEACPSLKDEYILKPIRSGKGAGILFGEDMTHHEWSFILETLEYPTPFTGWTYVVQRKVKQCRYEMVLQASGSKLHYPLVGTWHIMNGKFCGLGIWRSSDSRICAISSGSLILWSVSEASKSLF
ncbi:hypothetical protein F4808DRAFT_457407 [Astrocystis sublimbata]|nr:hypothetical protein F4808DRAFT_457407 [Astrocystis sublimbata]